MLFRSLLIWGVAGLLGLTAFIVLGDFHSVQERYLTPVLLPLVYWLCIRSRVSARPGATAFIAFAGATVAVIATSLLVGQTFFGRDQLAFPYRAIADGLKSEATGAAAMTGVTAFYSRQEKYAANLALLFPGLEIWRGQAGVQRVLVLLPKREPLSPLGSQPMEFERLFRPAGPPVEISASYENWSGATANVTALVYQRR